MEVELLRQVGPAKGCSPGPALTTGQRRCQVAKPNPSILDLPESLRHRIAPEPNSGCWLWTGVIQSRGYGTCYVGTGRADQRLRVAHRVIYERLVGLVPEGLVLDHLCRVRSCVNPAHLEPVTNRENILRGVGIAAQRSVAQKCSRGHIDWVIRAGTRHRTCRTCRRIVKGAWQRRYRTKLKLMAACHGIDVELVRHARGRGWR